MSRSKRHARYNDSEAINIESNEEFVNAYSVKEKFRNSEKRFNINIKPLTDHQKDLLYCLETKDIVIAHGCAGTGKSYVCMGYAAKELINETYDQLILCRSVIPATKSLGFFPGEVNAKLEPWLGHFINYLKGFLGKGTVECWMKPNKMREEKILMQPLEVIRGSSFDNKIIIIEESQNLTWKELKMIVTRIGNNSKLILSGDLAQSDLTKEQCGLTTLINLKDKFGIFGIGEVKFNSDDIVRSDIVKELIKAFEEEDL